MMAETAKEKALVGMRGAIAGMIAATAVMACGAESTSVPDGPVSARLRAAVEWLAAPEREGRGPGTEGIEAAADWVARQFRAIDQLQTRLVGDGPFQPFEMTLEATLGPADRNVVELVGPPSADGRPMVLPLELGRDFMPLAGGGSGE
jgi:hypothetical protein